jgi:hypothetical protein
MSTRAELDSKARDLGINPDEFSRKGELAAAIEDVENASEPKAVKTSIKGPVVVHALTHCGQIIEPGDPVPADLSDEAVQVLIEQGHVTG